MAILGSLLSGLGAGLRAGGGVLSPDVFAHNEQRRAAELQRADAQRSDMFKYVWSGMQDGSIDPQKGMQVLGQLDPQMAGQIAQQLGDSAFQPSYAAQAQMLTAQQKALELAQEQEDRQRRIDYLKKHGGEDLPPDMADEYWKHKNPAPAAASPSKINKMLGELKAARERGDTEAVAALTDAINLARTRAPGTSVTINNAAENSFQRRSGYLAADDQGATMKAGAAGQATQQTLAQTRQIMADGLRTNRPEAMLLGAQQMAEGLGLDIGAVAAKAGIKLGPLSTKEELTRLLSVLTVQSMKDMDNGNLNAQEVAIVVRAAADTGRTTEANIEAIAAASAAADLIALDAERAATATSAQEMRQVQVERARRGTKAFLELKKKYADEMRKAPEKAASIPAGVSAEQWNVMTPQERALWE